MHNHEAVHHVNLLIYIVVGVIILGYLAMVYMTNRTHKKWSSARIVFWILGVIAVTLGIIGPIAQQAMQGSFVAHMMNHLLLGMIGPLLIVLAAPMTLLLRSVPVEWGRFITRVLKSAYVRWVTHPVIASLINAGGLWVLYTTELYNSMHTSLLLHVLIHVHVFLAGYVFTLSMIYIEVTPHRYSFKFRAIVLILAMAAHGILSKWIYANPPIGVDILDAQQGGMLMYYGGDAVDLILVIILCYQYFSGKNRVEKRKAFNASQHLNGIG